MVHIFWRTEDMADRLPQNLDKKLFHVIVTENKAFRNSLE